MPYRIGIDARKLQEPGTGEYIQELVRGLAQVDEDNTYVLFVGGQYDDEFEELPENFVKVTERSPVFSVRERVALSWRQLREGLDLYHATHYILPLWVPRRTVATVYDIVDLLYPDFMPGRLSKYVAPTQIRATLSRTDRIIAASESTKADLVEYFDLRERKITRVYPGIDEAFRPAANGDRDSDREVLEELGLSGRYVLFRGDPRVHKNEERVLRAFAAATHGRDTTVRLAGLGDREISPERFGHLLSDLQIEDRVHWFDANVESRLPVLLRNAGLFLYPTLYEGFPTPVVEAMACGAPVVTSRHATLREIAEGSAKLVEPSSVESLAGAIGWCLHDEDLSRNLASDGLKRSGEFRWRHVAEQTLAIYTAALASGSSRSRLLPGRGRRSS